MPDLKSCGFLILRGNPIDKFLLMRHSDRWDLPKGHVDAGETEQECALRELAEETGITPADIEILPSFRFEHHYQVRGKRDGQLYDKTLVIFLARLLHDVKISCTEHGDYQWFPWQPPHQIQPQTIDPLLAAVEGYVAKGIQAPRSRS
jgi:8-oxo-dGTP pyrophosphatase MutT (NUDIX family)